MSKKHLIIEKSIELFAENGFESTSVQQITERCGISKGAFYLYFNSKDELIISIIDNFMSSLIADIEQSVSNETQHDQLLYNFIYVSFSEFKKHVNLAKLFLKEQVFSFNKELFERLQTYTSMLNKLMIEMVQKQFPQTKPEMHLDILFVISGLMKSYSEIFLIDDYKVDLEHLCNAIVEKVTIIAEQSTISVITPEYLTKTNVPIVISKEQVNKLLEEAIQETNENPIVQESLTLLKEDLENPTLIAAIKQGLLNNIRTNKHCRWVAYMYQLYINQTNQAKTEKK